MKIRVSQGRSVLGLLSLLAGERGILGIGSLGRNAFVVIAK
jgi:hypothetical protein